jgi:predicted ATPase
MPAIEKISIKGFKSIASIEDLALGAVNIVIGPNGSGKSNFIGVFSFLHAIREGRLQDYVVKAGGADKVLYFGSKITENVSVDITFQASINRYSLVLTPNTSDELIPENEIVSFWDKKNYPSSYDDILSRIDKEAGISESQSSKIATHVRSHLSRWRIYHFHDTSPNAPVKKTADVNDNRFLRADGANLAAFLYYLHVKHPDSYGMIRRSVQRVAPFFDDFILEPQQLNPEKIRLEWRHKDSDAYFDVSSLSDGTLRFIALATLFLQPADLLPSVILVDEPELGLHPYAITILGSLVKQASTHAQVILSTQSPQLLDQFEPEDVLVAQRVDGGTQLSRLDAERLGVWLDEYSLGQLWEKNELGGRPGERTLA